MPCPYFEPTQVAGDPHSAFGRLPLLAEFNGVCHCGRGAITGRSSLRFEGCNQGRAHPDCGFFPASEKRAGRRFTVRSRTAGMLVVLVLEEADHTPVRWREVRYSTELGVLDACGDECERGQIAAFCQTYLNLTRSTAAEA